MGAAVKAGIGLAVVIEVLSIVWILAGLLENPMMGLVFLPIAIILNVVAVFWALKQTASVNGYGGQLLSGLVLGVVAGILIFVFSLTNSSVLFPDAMDDAKAAQIEWVENSNLAEEFKDAQIEAVEAQTPWSQAMPALIGTVVTSLIAGAIVAAFVRKK